MMLYWPHDRCLFMLVVAIVCAASSVSAVGPAAAAKDALLPEPRRVIYPGEAIVDNLLVDVPNPQSVPVEPIAVDRAQLQGKIARHILLPMHPIPLAAIGGRPLVISGHIADAVFTEGSLSIRAKVMPLQDGREGETIRARNIDSNRIIETVVTGDGSLRVLDQ